MRLYRAQHELGRRYRNHRVDMGCQRGGCLGVLEAIFLGMLPLSTRDFGRHSMVPRSQSVVSTGRSRNDSDVCVRAHT